MSAPASRTVGDYTLLEMLGEGGMGVVHLARNDVTGERVALKILRPQIVGDEEGRQRLAREVSSLRRVRSRWVAEIIDADPWGPVPYVVMRYVPGRSLHDEVAEGGAVRGRDLRWLARCLIDAVAAVHAGGVLHRDVKPSNVIMEGRTPVLIDFGLARVADDPKITHTGWLLGTPGYLPPEILRGDDASPASDVHSWAATVAFAAIGRAPYGRGPSAAIMDRARRGEHDLTGVEPGLREVLDAALSPDPGRRPSVAELQTWLRHPGRALPGRPSRRRTAEGGPQTLAIFEDAQPDGPTLEESAGSTELMPEPWVGPAEPWDERAEPRDERAEPWPERAEPWPEPDERAEPWPAPTEPPVVRISVAERARRFVLWLALGLVCGTGVATAPWPALTAMVVLVVVMRGLSLAGSLHGQRREARGAKWYDGPRLIIGAPVDLVRSVPSTVVLVLWAGGLTVAAALICYAVAAPTVTTLLVSGVAFALMLWSGPGGARVRRPLARVVHPLSGRGARWLAALLVMLAVAVVLLLRLQDHGVDWAPGSGPPLISLF